jgi:hypothetical protein
MKICEAGISLGGVPWPFHCIILLNGVRQVDIHPERVIMHVKQKR